MELNKNDFEVYQSSGFTGNAEREVKKSVVNINSSQLNFPQLLTIAFICLRLTNYIDWNWLLIISPILISSIFKGLNIVNKLRSLKGRLEKDVEKLKEQKRIVEEEIRGRNKQCS